MTTRPIAIQMDHRVDLYIPSQCICGGLLPEKAREAMLEEVKSSFDSWFGGHAEIPIKGDWRLPDGSIAKEEVADIYSFCTAEALEEHREDVDDLAVAVANRLTQDRVLRVFDNIKVALWPNTLAGLQPTKNCVCHGALKLGVGAKPEPLGSATADQRSKMLIIQGILREFKSTEYARELFCGVLNYHFKSGELPIGKWPENLSSLLLSPPALLANHNGFKVVCLQLATDSLRRGAQRQVIQRIYRDDPTFRGLFVVTDKSKNHWELVNVKPDGEDAKRIVLRRMPVGIEGVRTATEQLATLEVSDTEAGSDIQNRHDKAFDVETLSKAFFGEIYKLVFQMEGQAIKIKTAHRISKRRS